MLEMPITFCTRCCDHRSSWDEKQKSTCPLHRSAYSFVGQISHPTPSWHVTENAATSWSSLQTHFFISCFKIDLGHTEVWDGWWSIHRQLRWQRSDIVSIWPSKPSITYSEISRPQSTGQSSQHWILYLPGSLRSARGQSLLFGTRGVITSAT